mmetsp:Transcript_36345/g.67640  ORF Transcript_36345/g.67640 Transcript_36345/m.67640 type:complete len:113 (+) Transcript_36345:64-402(+)
MGCGGSVMPVGRGHSIRAAYQASDHVVMRDEMGKEQRAVKFSESRLSFCSMDARQKAQQVHPFPPDRDATIQHEGQLRSWLTDLERDPHSLEDAVVDYRISDGSLKPRRARH